MTFVALSGTLFLLTQYLQLLLGYSTVKAGVVLPPQAGLIVMFSPLSNVWVQRLGNKIVVAAHAVEVARAMGLFVTHTATPTTSIRSTTRRR